MRASGHMPSPAAAQFNIGPFGIGTKMMTGDAGPNRTENAQFINGHWTYVEDGEYNPKIDTPDSRKLIKNRKALIEHIFGTLKRWMGKVPILLTSKEKVQIEVDLYVTAYNIRRLISITPVSKMLIRLQNTSI